VNHKKLLLVLTIGLINKTINCSQSIIDQIKQEEKKEKYQYDRLKNILNDDNRLTQEYYIGSLKTLEQCMSTKNDTLLDAYECCFISRQKALVTGRDNNQARTDFSWTIRFIHDIKK
jgi:phage gp36-like protein